MRSPRTILGKFRKRYREDGVRTALRRTWRFLATSAASAGRRAVLWGPIRTLLANVSRLLSYVQNQHRYESYRRKYSIHDTFRFPKPNTKLTGGGQIVIGAGGHIGEGSYLEAKDGTAIRIGTHARIGNNVRIYTQNNATDQVFIRADDQLEQVRGDVSLGDGVWIGDNAFITAGTEIGNNVVIGANAVVTDDVPDNVVVAGVPAMIKKRLSE